MSRIHNAEALPFTCEQRAELDYQADLWVVPWRKLGFDYCGIYLIAPLGKWPVKIGISTDAGGRLNSLQTAHWQQMRIMDYWVCENKAAAKKLESKCHVEFDKRRMMGEWFDIRADRAANVVEFSAEIIGVGISKKIPETARFQAVRDHIEAFYEARHRHFAGKSG